MPTLRTTSPPRRSRKPGSRGRGSATGLAAPSRRGCSQSPATSCSPRCAKRALEQGACRRLGLELSGTAAEPEERWLDGLEDALAELPEGQREAIRLRVEDDLAYDDVAASLGTTPEAARVRVHRGLAALRNRLSDAPRSAR
jgi:RNA polymerase sigma factor (sigma-70 family)